MSLNKLTLQNFRNIETADLSFSNNCNIIVGDNGAGKTNILESIYFLSLVRSFRTAQIKKLIHFKSEALQVVGNVKDGYTESEAILGIRKSIKETQIRINREPIKQSSKLATYLPVQAIHPQGHGLLEQGPKQRRQFLDWGVFHVEPSFLSEWHNYAHILKQRNAALRQRQQAKAIQLWDSGLIEAGKNIHHLRQIYLEKLQSHISYYCSELIGKDVEVIYQSGWAGEVEFSEALVSSLEQDQHLGFTRLGPHRADLIFKNENIRVQDYFSRGQLKLLVCALRLAQLRQLKDETKRDVVLLIDDLAAELDAQHRANLLNAALKTGAQLFITTTQLDLLEFRNELEHKVFHVKHGLITEMLQSVT